MDSFLRYPSTKFFKFLWETCALYIQQLQQLELHNNYNYNYNYNYNFTTTTTTTTLQLHHTTLH